MTVRTPAISSATRTGLNWYLFPKKIYDQVINIFSGRCRGTG